MVLTKDLDLPTIEELTVPEVNVSSSILKSAAFHLGKYCEFANNEFMLCRSEYHGDPRKCINEGKAVTACSLEFFQKMKSTCRSEFESYADCVDKSSINFSFSPCRKTQKVYDQCMLDKMQLERPSLGYFCELKVHDSARPKPEPLPPKEYPSIPRLPEDYPRPEPKYGGRPMTN